VNDGGCAFFGVTVRGKPQVAWANPVAVCLRLMLAIKISLALAQRRLGPRR
jgi:hypothetical protein